MADVRSKNNDLTPFLVFGLRGIELQCNRLLEEIRVNLSKALFRNQMYDLFNRLKSKRKRVIAERQLKMLSLLLERNMTVTEFGNATVPYYSSLKNREKAVMRDMGVLFELNAIGVRWTPDGQEIFARLEWPTEITETEFFRVVNQMPRAKTHKFLDH